MEEEVEPASSQRPERVSDLPVDLARAVAGGDEELEEYDHRDEDDLAQVPEAEKDEDDRHQDHLGDGIAEVDQRSEEPVEPFVAAEDKTRGHGKNKGREGARRRRRLTRRGPRRRS